MSISFAKMLIFAAPLGCLEETLALCSLIAADSSLYLPGAEAAAERQKVGLPLNRLREVLCMHACVGTLQILVLLLATTSLMNEERADPGCCYACLHR